MKTEDPLTIYDLPLSQTLFDVFGTSPNSRETHLIKIRMRPISVVDVSNTICAASVVVANLDTATTLAKSRL